MGTGSACVFVCAIRYISARKPYECVHVCGCACGRPYTRQAGTYILGGCARVHRPIGSKRSLSTRVSWTHASRTRRGLGPPLFECFFFRSLHFLCSQHIRIYVSPCLENALLIIPRCHIFTDFPMR